MKKLVSIVISIVVLAGCTTITKYATMEQNPKCEDMDAVKVFQTLDDGALALGCEKESLGTCLGKVVFVPKQKGEILYDDKRITAPEGKCIVFDNVYTYQTKENGRKTVPVIGFEDRFPNE